MIPKYIIDVGRKKLALKYTEGPMGGAVEIGGRCQDNGIGVARFILEECWWISDTEMKREVVRIHLHHQNQFFWAKLSPVDCDLWEAGRSRAQRMYEVTEVRSFGRLIR